MALNANFDMIQQILHEISANLSDSAVVKPSATNNSFCNCAQLEVFRIDYEFGIGSLASVIILRKELIIITVIYSPRLPIPQVCDQRFFVRQNLPQFN